MKGARQNFRNALSPVDLHHPLGHGAEDRLVIEFLKRLALLHAARHLAHEHDERGRILRGDMNAGRGIGGTGPPGHHYNTGLARHLTMGFRHESSATFLAADDGLDRRIMERIEHREITFARHAEDMAGTMDRQLVDEDLAAAAQAHWLVLSRRLRVPDTALAWPSKPS